MVGRQVGRVPSRQAGRQAGRRENKSNARIALTLAEAEEEEGL
jgi:hypothetical protein